jgi:DNA-binding GntR family transcriptional regulator
MVYYCCVRPEPNAERSRDNVMVKPKSRISAKAPRGTTHNLIYHQLRDALMNGDFLPGQRLVVRELADRFKTSPMPVREALRRLVSDEALYDHPNRGVEVPEATVEIISDLVRVRCSVEGAAAEWAATTITAEEIAQAEHINWCMKQCVSSQSGYADYLALNRQFHFLVYRASRSLVLQPVIERLWLRAGPWLNIMRQDTTLGLGLDHHAEVLMALRKGDGLSARRAIVADFSDASDIMLRAAAARSIETSQPRLRDRRKRVQKPEHRAKASLSG